MTFYDFRDIWDLWKGDFDLNKNVLEAAGPLWPNRRSCELREGILNVFGDPAGLREVGVYATFVAAAGAHVHLECEPKLEFTIAHDTLEARKKRHVRFNSFRYEARPVATSAPGVPASLRCRTEFHADAKTLEGDFWVCGDSEALLYFALRALDLAEPGTSVGTEIAFLPERALAADSPAFRLGRM